MASDPSDLPSAALELFAMDPDDFIAARDALAKQLKTDGETESATAVKALRRPTVAAWAANQAARSDPDTVQELLDAGERLAGAQRKMLTGKGAPDDLREAGERRRELIRRLTDVAAAELDRAGRPSDGPRDEIAGTLEAATLDPDVAARLRSGILERTVRPPSGLGSFEGFTVLEGGAAASPKKERAPARDAKKQRHDAERVVEAAQGAESAATEAEERARSARAAADEAARQAEELEAAARDAEREARRLANEAKTARKRAERAIRTLG